MSKAIHYILNLFQAKERKPKFSLGNLVVVCKNSNRLPQYAKLGHIGEVTGYCEGDVVVVLNDNDIIYAIEDDLLLIEY